MGAPLSLAPSFSFSFAHLFHLFPAIYELLQANKGNTRKLRMVDPELKQIAKDKQVNPVIVVSLTDVPEVQVSRVQEVTLVNHVPHPLAVVHVTLTSLYAGK